MSGPKDYGYRLSDEVIAMLNVRRTVLRTAIQSRVEASIRRRPSPRKQVDVTLESFSSEKIDSKNETLVAEQSERLDKDKENNREQFSQLCNEIQASIESLGEEEVIRSFCNSEYVAWVARCSEVIAQKPSRELLIKAQGIKDEGDQLIEQALDLSQKKEKQRKVQQAIVDSFHAIGFFTELPEPSEVSNPDQALTIVARKGNEKVTVSLPLGDTPVQSNWQGQTDERCVDSFYDYVEQMGKRGIECRAVRKDLQDRPKLRHHGQKELPRSHFREH